MPGKSKKGGGLESSPVYKKQKFGAPFKMSGMAFKEGQTPIKQLSSRAIDEEIKEVMEEPIEIDVPENIETQLMEGLTKNPEIKSEKIPLPL